MSWGTSKLEAAARRPGQRLRARVPLERSRARRHACPEHRKERAVADRLRVVSEVSYLDRSAPSDVDRVERRDQTLQIHRRASLPMLRRPLVIVSTRSQPALIGWNLEVAQAVERDLRESGCGDVAAIDRAMGIVDGDENHEPRLRRGHDADEGGHVLVGVSAGLGIGLAAVPVLPATE